MSGVVRVQVSDETMVITGALEIDISNVGDLQASLDEGIARGCPVVVVDLSQTTFIDSAALAALLRANTALRDGGRALRIVEGGPDVTRVFFVTGTSELLSIVPSLADAT